MKIGFDHDLYTRTQSEHIRERINHFGGKLYLELGGKLFDDNHASRVLPGFRPDSKISMLLTMKEQIELNIYVRDAKAASTKGSTSCVVTESGEEITLIKIDDIAVSQAKEPISFTVTMSDGSTFDVVYSIKDYVINALAASENDQSDLMIALQKYVDSAIASTK